MSYGPVRDEETAEVKAGLLADDVEKGKDALVQGRKSLWTKVVDGFCIILNIASTVILVFLNNWYVADCTQVDGNDVLMFVFPGYLKTLN